MSLKEDLGRLNGERILLCVDISGEAREVYCRRDDDLTIRKLQLGCGSSFKYEIVRQRCRLSNHRSTRGILTTMRWHHAGGYSYRWK